MSKLAPSFMIAALFGMHTAVTSALEPKGVLTVYLTGNALREQ
jgi:hypothetical protein